MLLPRQWSRIAGTVLAALLFVFSFEQLNLLCPSLRPLRNSYTFLHGQSAAEAFQPHTGQQEDRATGTFERMLSEPTETFSELTHTPSSFPVVPSSSEERILLQGTRVPANPSITSSVVHQPSNLAVPAASEPSAPVHDSDLSPTFRKTIVMGKLLSEDTDWVEQHVKGWENAIYVVDLPANETSPTGHKTKINKSKEATPYLTYMVEHYDDFPHVAVFMHSHRNGWPRAWHNEAKDHDAVLMLKDLRLDTVQRRGYVNLRCSSSPGCPDEITMNRNPPDLSKSTEVAYPHVFGQFFNMTVDQVKEQVPIVATPCCAQFAVSREQFWKRPKSDYERYLRLIEQSDYDDQTLGTVMEYMWHIIFDRDAVFCEDVISCSSAVYGRGGWD